MKLPRRKFLYLAAGATALAVVSQMAWAQQPSSEAESLKKGTRVITLGTRSGPTPTVGRAQA